MAYAISIVGFLTRTAEADPEAGRASPPSRTALPYEPPARAA